MLLGKKFPYLQRFQKFKIFVAIRSIWTHDDSPSWSTSLMAKQVQKGGKSRAEKKSQFERGK